MSSSVIYDLSKDGLQFSANRGSNGKARYGFEKKYIPTGLTTQSAVAQCTLSYDDSWPNKGVNTTKTVTVWDDGKITLDGAASIATATLGVNRWAQIFPTTVPAWDSVASLFKPKNVAILLTTGKLYIVDPTAPIGSAVLYDYPLSDCTTPTTSTTSSGLIQAGTYRFAVTEVSHHGVETELSSPVQVTSATDFQQIISYATKVNSDCVRWRLYMARQGAGGEYSSYRFVDEAAAATLTITANVDFTGLGFVYDSARVQTPATVTVGCMHQGTPVFSGDPLNAGRIFVSAASISDTTDITGYSDIGNTIATYESLNGKPITAMVSLRDILVVFTEDAIFAYSGTIADTTTVTVRTVSNSVGTDSFRKVAIQGDTIFFMNTGASDAWVSDGYRVKKINEEHLFHGIWYYLNGNQTINYRDELQGQFTAELVAINPDANEVFFGGEIVSTTYADSVSGGTWSAAAVAATPQDNRQYVWKVFRIDDKAWETYTNIPIKAWSIKDGKTYFADQVRNVYSFYDEYVYDSAGDGVLVSNAISGDGTDTITISGGWSGTANVNSPVTIVNLGDGTSQLRYVVSSTSTTITLDDTISLDSTCFVIYGVPVVDLWTEAVPNTVDVYHLDIMAGGYTQDGTYAMFGSFKDNAGLSRWFQIDNLAPTSDGIRKYGIGRRGRSPFIRLLAPPAYGLGLSLQLVTKHYVHTLRMKGRVIEDGIW